MNITIVDSGTVALIEKFGLLMRVFLTNGLSYYCYESSNITEGDNVKVITSSGLSVPENNVYQIERV